MEDREVLSTRCYICDKAARKKIRWFTPNGKHYYSVSYCEKHGYLKGKIRIRKNICDPESVFVIKTMKLISKEDVDKIIEKKGQDIVLVSLARAGIPIGILVKRYIAKKYQVNVPHYSISIIRGRGIDDNAMKYLLSRYEPGQLLFVDGWIGKGAILNELKKDLAQYEGVSSDIAVIADPANVTELCGTHDDILIPSSCLNSTVSGLISRTFLRSDIIRKDDFHGAVYYGELKDSDLSYEFIHTIENEFEMDVEKENKCVESSGIDEVKQIAKTFDIDDINLIKPGIGEATRVLLRRVPWKILIDERYKGDPQLGHLVRLAEEKNVSIQYYPMKHYKCCGIIKKMSDI